MLNKKNIIIFLFLIVLLALSGCLGFITTREKQACLALTHYSSTSVANCASQRTCYNQVDNLGYVVSENLPYEIHNDFLKYKNHVGSSYFYYNQTVKNLDNINKACFNEKPKEILETVNYTMFYFTQLFDHIDKSTKQSINLIVDYTLFLEKQEVYLIPEEPIYDDFILLNENINLLKDPKINDTYASKINQEFENLYLLAKEFGLSKTYLSKKNFSDLSLYYLEVYDAELNAHEIFVPEVMGLASYVINRLSDIENLRRININLARIEPYNFYSVFNRFLGKDNSLIINFKEINDSINQNLIEVYKKISDIEIFIIKNKKYLSQEKVLEFNRKKIDFENQNLSFGKYLSYLKDINNKILINKIEEDKLNVDAKNKLLECDVIVKKAGDFTSIFYKNNVDLYNLTDNYLEKIEICNILKNAINEDACSKKIYDFLKIDVEEKKDFEFFIYKDEFTCLEILGNINYKLNFNEKIMLFKEIIKEANAQLNEAEIFAKSYELRKEIYDYKEEISRLDENENILNILNIDNKIRTGINIKEEIKTVSKNVFVENEFWDIIYLEGYYFVFNNPFSFSIENIIIENKFRGLESKDDLLTVSNTRISIDILYPGKNYFKINYENKKEISISILNLGLEESILKINIKNEIQNIFDEISFLDGFKTNNSNVTLNENRLLYLTEKENNIFVQGDLFLKNTNTTLNKIDKDSFLLIEEIKIKNRYIRDINQKLYVKDVLEDTKINIFKNNKLVNSIIEDGRLYIDLDIKIGEEKTVTIKEIIGVLDVFYLVENTILEIEIYKYSRFEDVLNIYNQEVSTLLNLNELNTATVDELVSVLNKKNIIDTLKQNTEKNIIAETNYFLIYNNIDKESLNQEETLRLKTIDDNKYKDIKEALEKLNVFINEVQVRILDDIDQKTQADLIFINEIKEIIKTYDLEGIDINKINDKDKIEEIINLKLKDKAQKIYLDINPEINNFTTREIDTIISKIRLLYSDYSLTDVQSIGYFASISLNDVERLEKNMVFLDGVLFNRELGNFETHYENQDYKRAINSFSNETIRRVERIKIEFDLLKKGFNAIKNDSRDLITTYQKQEIDNEILTLAKRNYEEEKYLNTIVLLKSTVENKKNIVIFNQYFISLLILVIFGFVYFYLKKDAKKREPSIKEKKKKIIRH